MDGTAAVERASADDQGAIAECLGEGVEDSCVAQQIGSAYGGFGFHPVNGEGGYDAEALEAKVGHGTGGRADVERVARGDEDDVEAAGLVWGQQMVILNRLLSALLFAQLGAEGLLGFGYVGFVASGVDKDVGAALRVTL